MKYEIVAQKGIFKMINDAYGYPFHMLKVELTILRLGLIHLFRDRCDWLAPLRFRSIH
jgi:hypothetical protein